MGNFLLCTKRMKVVAFFLLLIAPLLLLVFGSFYIVAAGENNHDDKRGRCSRCGDVEMTGELKIIEYSSINKRSLAAQKYIIPDVYRVGQPACGKVIQGDPYSKSCLPPPSNPHNRGCSTYYRCRM